MVRQYAAMLGAANPEVNPVPVDNLFNLHPLEIAAIIERHWQGRVTPPPPLAPFPANPLVNAAFVDNPFAGGPFPNPHPHLIYAYMVENTRIFDIFRRLCTEYVQGERLEIPTLDGQRWLRNTEELFFRDPPPFLSFTLTSQLRPDPNASRRNAYYRMFGLDLNHGTDDNKPYPYVKAAAANREFVPTLELLLTEVWRGVTNAANTSGPSDTDNVAIATLATRLDDMLRVRRGGATAAPTAGVGNLAREEFWFTAAMSWFHLTIAYNSPIVMGLRADATSPEDRLRKLGERVGLPCHAKSQAFFILADQMSLFLRQIEAGAYSTTATARALYNPPVDQMMTEIITQYSVATGRDIKARTVVLNRRTGVAAV
jgi:hypothetical protein